jgi:hypothetical protein
MWILLSWLTATFNPAESASRLANELSDLVNEMKLTAATVNDDGTVAETPQALATQASTTTGAIVSVEEYALARMVACECTRAARGGNDGEKAAIVWVALNDANAHHAGDIVQCLTGGHGFGHQGSLRAYATSANDPTVAILAVVRSCLTGQTPDPTGGSTHFMHRTGFTDHSAYLAAVSKWQGYGWQNIGLDVGTSLEVWT